MKRCAIVEIGIDCGWMFCMCEFWFVYIICINCGIMGVTWFANTVISRFRMMVEFILRVEIV